MFYRLSFNSGRAEALKPGETCEPYVCAGHMTTPRFGFCWWFWLPTFYYNGARLDRFEVLDLSLSWLCFWCSITAWPKQVGTLKPWFHSSLDGLRTAKPRAASRHQQNKNKPQLRRA